MDCLFCKIANGNGDKVYEDNDFVIINDLNPQAKLHYLLIPKKHFDNISEMASANADLLAKAFKIIAENAERLGLGKGFRIISNVGEYGCQSVKHIHIHILGGEKLSEKMG